MDEYYLDVIREQAAEFGAGYAGKYDEYVSVDSPASQLIAGMRSAVATVPPYCERPQTDADDRFVSLNTGIGSDLA